MKKQVFVNSLIYFIAMLGACLVNLAVSAMAVKIVNLFIVVDYFSAAIIRTVIAFVTLSGVIGALTWFESFKSAEFHPLKTLVAVGLGGVYHLAVSTILMFYPFIAGGTRYLAGLINMGERFDSFAEVEYIYLWAYLTAFFIYLFVEMICAVVCGYLGKKKRYDNRKTILGFEENN